jgi:hypothetical protein
MTDGAFLFEAPWRNTWPTKKWQFDSWHLPSGVPYAELVVRYAWESHLDAALQDGYSSYLPSSWLARVLKLKADRRIAGIWRDDANEVLFQTLKGEDGGSVVLLRQDAAERIAGNNTTFLTVLISERSAWPGGHNASWRRSEGVCWRSGRGVEAQSWTRDKANGESGKYISQ